ncbi:MAG: carboxypeptidase regulatory-like domain-containing protein, partial [Planctomycetes bacterium]|nr:carboxypeptidase regulatory-like domain-containing protein [Planctomycetota bacterium]
DERQNVTIDLVRPENRKDSKLIKRKVTFKFVLDENTDKPEETSFVSPSGSLEIEYTKMHPSGQRYLYSQYAEIDKGQAVCDVVTLDNIDCSPHDIKGFWFKKKTIKLTASKDPLVVHIPCVEAGAILGQIQGADRGFARLNVVKRATSKETGLSGLESQRLGLDGKFMVSPVPLGGTYRIVASHNQTYMVSEAITLTKAEPFKTLQMELPKGQEVVCTVLDPNGAPCSNLEYTFNHHVDGMGGSGGHGGLYTNASGQIVLPGVNFAAPITYSITMKPKDYQPVKHALSQATLNSPIHLKKGLHVDGVVRDEEDRPVPGLEVYCMLYHNKAWAWVTYVEAEAKTDAQGRFQFNNLPPGNYTLGCRSAKEIGETAIVAGQKKQAIVRIENRG